MATVKEQPNFWKVLGNALTAFATTMLGVSLVGLDMETAFKVALVPAMLQAVLAAGKEMTYTKGILDKVTLF